MLEKKQEKHMRDADLVPLWKILKVSAHQDSWGMG